MLILQLSLEGGYQGHLVIPVVAAVLGYMMDVLRKRAAVRFDRPVVTSARRTGAYFWQGTPHFDFAGGYKMEISCHVDRLRRARQQI